MDAARIYLDNSGLYADPDYMSIDIFRSPQADSNKIAFVFHGKDGCSDSPHLLKMIEPYLQRNYLVVSPNLCHSQWNDSAGQKEDFLISYHVRDCARTIEWAKNSREILNWHGNDIALCGHSMGGYAATFLAAATYNRSTKHVLTIAPFTDGTRHLATRANPQYHVDGIKTLNAECTAALIEWPQHSLYSVIDKLHMPVSTVVGINDTITLPSDIGDFFDALPNGADRLVLADEHHCLIGDNIPIILEKCIKNLEERSEHKLSSKPSIPTPPFGPSPC